MAEAADIALIRASGLFDAAWYLRRYPDVARVGLDPLTHYVRIGMELGRDPGPGFSARAYLAANPDVAAAGRAPLLHYLATGRAEGRAPTPPAAPRLRQGPGARLAHLRGLLETGGLTAGPLAEIEALVTGAETPALAAAAAGVRALWALHEGAPEAARAWVARAPGGGAPVLRLLAGAQARVPARARDADLHLAATVTARSPRARLACLNRALALDGLAPLRLRRGAGPAFDRLEARPLPPAGTQGPRVTVLMAAHDAGATIGTAIAALRAQSWRDFELIVIDDASTDDTAEAVTRAAGDDSRIRLVRLARNRGAYGARNAGLAQARGQYVTLHDADDRAHPERLARQMAFLAAHRGHAGCLATQARVGPDLAVTRWTGEGAPLFEDMTSILLPRDLLRDCLGGWDETRVSADSELARRVRRLFGDTALPLIPGGPLALQRAHAASATADGALGMGWFYYGARRDYYEAQQFHHARAACLRYAPGSRPFPVPGLLRPGAGHARAVDRVYAGALTGGLGGLEGAGGLIARLAADRAAGRTVGLVPLYSMALPVGGGLSIHPHLRALVDGEGVSVLCFGEEVTADDFLRLPDQPGTDVPHRHVPVVRVAGEVVLAPG